MHGPTCIFWANPTTFSLQLTEPFVDGMWRNRARDAMHLARPGVDIGARAGDVILINNTNIHAGTVRAGPSQRVDFRCPGLGRTTASHHRPADLCQIR